MWRSRAVMTNEHSRVLGAQTHHFVQRDHNESGSRFQSPKKAIVRTTALRPTCTWRIRDAHCHREPV